MASRVLIHGIDQTPIPLRADRFEVLVRGHEAFVAGHQGGRRATLRYIVAPGMTCDRRMLADARFEGADLTGTSFVETDLSRVSFYCANLSRCDFRGARLTRADLRGSTFNGALLAGANLDGADMRAAVLYASDGAGGLRWIGGRMVVAVSGEAADYNVDFTNASLQGARLREANLKHANFSGANLHGADLIGARLEGANFRGAVLTGLDVSRLAIPRDVLATCVLDPTPEDCKRVGEIEREIERAQDWIATNGAPAHLDGFDLRPAGELFRGRLLAGLQAKGAVGIGVDFAEAKLQGANFANADLRAADFTGADLRGVSFVNAQLSHARFEGAILGELELKPGLRIQTRFDGASTEGAGLPA